MSAPDTSEYTTEAGSVYLQAGQSYAVTSNWPIVIIAFPEGGGLMDAQMVAFSEQVGGSFEFTSTVTGHGLIRAKTGDNEQAIITPIVRAVFNRAPGASSSGTGGSSSSSAPTPPYVAYNADRSEITAADLSGLTDGQGMFYQSKVISFGIALPQLKSGYNMFLESSRLQSFSSDISAMTRGDVMFYNCSKLTSFSSDLSSLSAGGVMFFRCKLDKESALRVLNTIPTYTSGSREITLGMDASLNGDADITAALTAASNKGWTVTAQYN